MFYLQRICEIQLRVLATQAPIRHPPPGVMRRASEQMASFPPGAYEWGPLKASFWQQAFFLPWLHGRPTFPPLFFHPGFDSRRHAPSSSVIMTGTAGRCAQGDAGQPQPPVTQALPWPAAHGAGSTHAAGGSPGALGGIHPQPDVPERKQP